VSGLAAAAAAWTFALTPYAWLPNANGTLRFAPPGSAIPPAGLGPNDPLEHLQLALMAAFEARKADWAIVADFIHLDFAKDSASLKGLVWQVAASRALGERGSLEALGGLRSLVVEASLDSAGVAQERTLSDAIVGVRGRIHTSEGRWYFPYYLDAGAGSSSFTWQGFAGVGYSFKWGEALLTYRHLHYEQGGDKLVQRLDFSGPAVGATFRF
jgi:hypothetical protein